MRATHDLKQEHRVIEIVLSALDRMADRLDQGESLSREEAEKALEIPQVFVGSLAARFTLPGSVAQGQGGLPGLSSSPSIVDG